MENMEGKAIVNGKTTIMNRKLRRLQEKHGVKAKVVKDTTGTSFIPEKGIKAKAEPDYDEKGELRGYFIDIVDDDGNVITKEVHEAMGLNRKFLHSKDSDKADQIDEAFDNLVPLKPDGSEAPHFFCGLYIDENVTSLGRNLVGDITDHMDSLIEAMMHDERVLENAKMLAQVLMASIYMAERPEEFKEGAAKGEFEVTINYNTQD